MNCRCRLQLKLKELLYSQKYSHWIRVLLYCCLLWAASIGTTIEQLPVKDRLSQQFWQSQGCFTCARAILGYDLFDFLLNYILLANIKRLCWTLQVVEWVDILVYTNDVLQCLHSLLIRPEMQGHKIFALFDKHHNESYSLFSILASILNNIFSYILLKWLCLSIYI